MLLCTIDEFQRYIALHPRFAEAHRWIRRFLTEKLPDGKHEISGEQLFVTAETGETHPYGKRKFESHRRYIDIQVVLEGTETMHWWPIDRLHVREPFQDGVDYCFYADPLGAVVDLNMSAGHVVVFWPSDGHKPVCHPPAGPSRYRKLVFKVEI